MWQSGSGACFVDVAGDGVPLCTEKETRTSVILWTRHPKLAQCRAAQLNGVIAGISVHDEFRH